MSQNDTVVRFVSLLATWAESFHEFLGELLFRDLEFQAMEAILEFDLLSIWIVMD